MSQPTEDIVNYRLAKKHFERKQKIVVLKNSYQYRNRRRITVKRFMLGLLVGVVAVAVLYFLYGMKYRSAFLPNTIIDGVDASGETIEEFQQHMADEISKYILVLDERGDKQEQLRGVDVGLHVELNQNVKQILENQNPLDWFPRLWKEETYQSFISITYNKDLLAEAIKHLECMDLSRQYPAENAYISEYNLGTDYVIVPEMDGTQIIEANLQEAVGNVLLHLDEKVCLADFGCYRTPAVCSSDNDLQELVKKMNGYADVNVTYRFGENTEVLDGETIRSWIVLTGNGELSFDDEKINGYIREIASAYDTAYTSRMFQTSYGSEVCVWQGHYGWKINQEEEAEALKEILCYGESVEREPIYLQEAASHGTKDYGDTYVELNMTAQHLWLYKDGELVLESDFVSGNLAKGYETPNGIYPITYKERNARLMGEGYDVGVTYWMPFNRGIGLHDANWRTTFGGTIYKTRGSHGCVNLPPENAKIIYETVEKGTAVICYTLEGTESSSVTKIAVPNKREEPENAEETNENIPTETAEDLQQQIEPAQETTEMIVQSEMPDLGNG